MPQRERNKNAVYILEHSGHYLGGVIVVVASDIDAAAERITLELVACGVAEKDFDTSKIQPIDTDKAKTVYVDSGDY